MGVDSLPKTVTGQRRGCDWNPGPTAPESSTLTTRLPSHMTVILVTTKHCGSMTDRWIEAERSEQCVVADDDAVT